MINDACRDERSNAEVRACAHLSVDFCCLPNLIDDGMLTSLKVALLL